MCGTSLLTIRRICRCSQWKCVAVTHLGTHDNISMRRHKKMKVNYWPEENICINQSLKTGSAAPSQKCGGIMRFCKPLEPLMTNSFQWISVVPSSGCSNYDINNRDDWDKVCFWENQKLCVKMVNYYTYSSTNDHILPTWTRFWCLNLNFNQTQWTASQSVRIKQSYEVAKPHIRCVRCLCWVEEHQ